MQYIYSSSSSFRFLFAPLALRKLGPAMNVAPDVEKSYFPDMTKYLTEEWAGAIFPFPSIYEFGWEKMNVDERAKLHEWYHRTARESNGYFDFNEQLYKYGGSFHAFCRNDVI